MKFRIWSVNSNDYPNYPPVIKHGVLEKGPFIGDVPMNPPPFVGDFPLPCLITRGYMVPIDPWLVVKPYPSEKYESYPLVMTNSPLLKMAIELVNCSIKMVTFHRLLLQ